MGGVIRQNPPDYDGPARPVPRRDAATFTAAEFYWRFVREGLPVVLTNFFDAADPSPFWRGHIARVDAAARARYAALSAARGGTPDNRDCEGSKSDDAWCDKGVQVCTGDCHAAATLPAHALPRALRGFATSHGLLADERRTHDPATAHAEGGGGGVGELATNFEHPVVFWWERDPNTFGGPLHFDIGCASSLSVHYRGAKHWHLWTPWDLPARLDSAEDFCRLKAPCCDSQWNWIFIPAYCFAISVHTGRKRPPRRRAATASSACAAAAPASSAARPRSFSSSGAGARSTWPCFS